MNDIILIAGVLIELGLTVIGVKQMKSPTPVSFYPGDEPPSENMLKDLKKWNYGHGILWMAYGIIVLICFWLASESDDGLIKALLMFCGAILPAGGMALGHSILRKKFYL